jgi:hypothetical protein
MAFVVITAWDGSADAMEASLVLVGTASKEFPEN